MESEHENTENDSSDIRVQYTDACTKLLFIYSLALISPRYREHFTVLMAYVQM